MLKNRWKGDFRFFSRNLLQGPNIQSQSLSLMALFGVFGLVDNEYGHEKSLKLTI